MKKLFLFAMVAAALSGCSNSDEVDTNPEVQPGGEGYVGFSIQLPTTSSSATRANDEFDDGNPVPDEYKVNNATMFIFKGLNEANATLVKAYAMNVNTFNTSGTPTDQCTTEGIVSSKITKPETNPGENIYAYVMINSNDMIDTGAKTIDGHSYEGLTFENFSKLKLSKIGTPSNGMVMTNAPVSNMVGGASDPTTSATVTTLTELEKSKIYATQAEAELNPAGEVYMERAAVKVTVTKGITGLQNTSTGNVQYDAESIKWALSNVNNEYYNTRQMNKSWLRYHAQGDGSDANIEGTVNLSTKYRFISGNFIHDGGAYRTYWGDATFSAPGSVNEVPGTSAYTFENTFDVKRQVTKNTTGIAVSATFNGGKSFYTASTNGDNKILQEPSYGGPEDKIQDYIMTYLCNNYSQFKTWYDKIGGKNRITVTMDNTTPAAATVDAVTTVAGADPLPAGFDATNIKDALNNSIKFKYYNDGVAYYNVLIRHFEDLHTPWTRENPTENHITGVYQSITGTPLSENLRDNNYLGRYGIVRNNWYQIKITGIRQIGSPVIVDPSGNDNPDDNVDNYLSVKIHITPWAVRKQSVEL